MDLYQEFIYKGHYSRWLPAESRRETWKETCNRYLAFWESKGLLSDAESTELFMSIHNLEVMPSMRALMTAGKALERDHVAGYNCFSGSTEFITNEGMQSLSDCVDKKVEVLTEDGFKPATVKAFGPQTLQGVTFRPTNSKSLVRQYAEVTKNHRWYTINRGWVTDLNVGDSVPSCVVEDSTVDQGAFIRGFGFGDGTIDNRGRAQVRLCGGKSKLLSVFEEFGHCSIMSPPSCNGDPLIVFHKDYLTNWKTLPEYGIEDIPYLSSWLLGYLAADGHTDPNQPGLSTQDRDAADFVSYIAPLCGYVVTGDNTSSIMETNFGTRSSPLIRLTLRKKCVYCVTAIEELSQQEVFCVVEPETETFTLANGILTGNCSYTTVAGKGESIELSHAKLDAPVVVHVSDVLVFDEIMYLLMCGTGVGFSVERQYVNTLPAVGQPLNRRRYLPFNTNYPGVERDELSTFDRGMNIIHIADSKYGWASALRILVIELFNGNFAIQYDLSMLRAAGARLETFGGRSSGPEPLDHLFKNVIAIITGAGGRKLNSIECHDICCMIGEAIVVGGVRRSALISLSNLTDDRMRRAKMGDWWDHTPHRQLANNSICFTEKPDFPAFLHEWKSLYESYSGERGIFNRVSSEKQAAKSGRRAHNPDFGTNPCSEIILRPNQFCNLSEVVVRATDTIADLERKVRHATIFGTLQSTLTDFKYLQPIWRENCEEESLLGVSLTGIMDHPILSGSTEEARDVLPSILRNLRDIAIQVNAVWADRLGVNRSAAITCVKPSGTVSQLVNSSSGIHPRYAKWYIRRVRIDQNDPLADFMSSEGVPYQMQGTNYVFEFPQAAPEGARTVPDFLGVPQLELWKLYQDNWCEHKPSITVYYQDADFFEIGQWVYNHFDDISGVSFLPYDDHTYELAPYEPISEEKYEQLQSSMPESVDWGDLSKFESTDNTTGSQELACTGASCEVVDIT